MIIYSKRNFLFLFGYIFLGAFCATFGIFGINFSFTELNQGESAKIIIGLLASVALFLFAGFSIWNYIKGSQKILMDEEKMAVGKEEYFWKDLTEAKLTGKIKIIGLLGFKTEGMTLKFNNSELLHIVDSVYQNAGEMKSFIFTKTSDNRKMQRVFPSSEVDIADEFFIDYKGNAFLSFRGILLWGFVTFIFYIFFIKSGPLSLNEKLAFVIPLLVFCLAINTWQMHYFSLSNKVFKISNHYLFWKKRFVRIIDIREIVFETQPKQANMLRIITKDFNSKLYPAASLTNKTWLELKNELENLEITVRNECI